MNHETTRLYPSIAMEYFHGTIFNIESTSGFVSFLTDISNSLKLVLPDHSTAYIHLCHIQKQI